MPPKLKETVKKPNPQLARPSISNATLLYIPCEAVEGFQERIESGISWTLVEEAARHHKQNCRKEDIPKVTFSQALAHNIRKSYLHGFLDENSKLSLDQQWELMLSTILWDNEKFSNNEGKACFHSVNSVTNDLVKLIKKAVNKGDRDILKKDLKMVQVLRVIDSQMTDLDRGLTEYKHLVTLNLCGNFIENIDCSFIPTGLRILELQGNRIRSVEPFAQYLPTDLIYLGLSRNLLTSDKVKGLSHLPQHLTVLDLSENDIYNLEPLLNVLVRLQNLTSLMLAGNPCAMCAAYARTLKMRLQGLNWLDLREILPTDRSLEPYDPHPDDLRSTYFNFTILRVMSIPPPPKPEKGAIATFHVELEIPLLDATRRKFLLFRRNESLMEMLPPSEDDEWPVQRLPSNLVDSKSAVEGEGSSHESDIYRRLTTKNSREICHFTTFESNKVQWNKVMTFQEPSIRIFCPDLVALRDTFRSIITVRLIYSVTNTIKQGKLDKKSGQFIKGPGEQRAVLASIKCALRSPDWSQPSQHFHWDDSLGTGVCNWATNNFGSKPTTPATWYTVLDNERGNGESAPLARTFYCIVIVLQYSQTPAKPTKDKPESDVGSSRQTPPDNLTCHFAFGIDTLRA